ncbi:unnamed protein product, partial [Phaeothamnion confervicola]
GTSLDEICDGIDEPGPMAALYMLGVLYVLIGLAVIYDEFLQHALLRVGESLRLSPSVTAATVGVAGSCAPRLFVVLADAFDRHSGIGVATVIGSGIFNLSAYVGLAAAAVGRYSTAEAIHWPPLVRDAVFVIVAAVLLGATALTGGEDIVQWWEAVYLLGVFVVYIAFSSQWTKMSAVCISTQIADAGQISADGEKAAASINGGDGSSGGAIGGGAAEPPAPELTGHEAETGNGQPGELVPRRSSMTLGVRNRAEQRRSSSMKAIPGAEGSRRMSGSGSATAAALAVGGPAVESRRTSAWNSRARPPGSTGHVTDQEELVAAFDRFAWPNSALDRTIYVLAFPFLVIFSATVPDCQKPEFKRWHFLTAIIALAWTAVLAYFMTSWAVIAACSMDIQPCVLGFIYPALGTSLPDAVGAAIVARDGGAATAVSGALTASVFDFTVGLGLPWILKNIAGGAPEIDPAKIRISLIILLCGVPGLVCLLKAARWRLTAAVGLVLRVLYIAYVGYIIINAIV